MESQERKAKFVTLLQELLNECGGVKKRLAQKLQIIPSTLTRWLQGQIDPAGLEVSVFQNVAKLKQCSIDELAIFFEFPGIQQRPIDKFRALIKELLLNQTQEELAVKIGLSQITISNWLNPEISLDPRKIPTPTMFAVAKAKGWTLERLLIYLGLESGTIEQNLFSKYQLELSVLSLNEQIAILNWLLDFVDNKVDKSLKFDLSTLNKKKLSDRNIGIIFEKEDIEIGFEYLKNLNLYAHIKIDNIKITNIANICQSNKNFDLLLFDIETNLASLIEVIEKILFDGDIVIFTSQDFESEVRSQLEDKVTDIVVKPIDWQDLKNKSYF